MPPNVHMTLCDFNAALAHIFWRRNIKMDNEMESKVSNESDAISLFYDGDSLLSDGEMSKKHSLQSMTSLDEYLAAVQRFRSDDSCAGTSNSQNSSTDDRVSSLTKFCTELVANGRKEEMHRLCDMSKSFRSGEKKVMYDCLFKCVLAKVSGYSSALKHFLEMVDGVNQAELDDFIARKIVNNANDIEVFVEDLKKLIANGYTFEPIMINRLMSYCIEHFNMQFHQFVLTQIVNKLSKDKLDMVNEPILQKFVQRRLTCASHSKFGLASQFLTH